MLTALGGRTHLVATGVGIRWPEGQVTFVEQTLVTFRPLSQEEILAYVDTGEPMDKAGGYGLQGIGGSFVSKFEGYESTVIGFPIERIRAELEKYGLV
jgi:septum formation protein